jgi:hypothetical protein
MTEKPWNDLKAFILLASDAFKKDEDFVKEGLGRILLKDLQNSLTNPPVVIFCT